MQRPSTPQESRLSDSMGLWTAESVDGRNPMLLNGAATRFGARSQQLMGGRGGFSHTPEDTAACFYLSGSFFTSSLRFRSAATRIGRAPIGAAAISPCPL